MAAAPFLFTPVESGLGGLTLGLLAFAKLQITGRCTDGCRSMVGSGWACMRWLTLLGLVGQRTTYAGMSPHAHLLQPAHRPTVHDATLRAAGFWASAER